MAAVVGGFTYDGIKGKITMRYIGPTVRIALDIEQIELDDRAKRLITQLKKLEIPRRTEVFDLKSPETHFIILAGDRFRNAEVPFPAENSKLSVDTARGILTGLEEAAPGLSFEKLEAYAYL